MVADGVQCRRERGAGRHRTVARHGRAIRGRRGGCRYGTCEAGRAGEAAAGRRRGERLRLLAWRGISCRHRTIARHGRAVRGLRSGCRHGTLRGGARAGHACASVCDAGISCARRRDMVRPGIGGAVRQPSPCRCARSLAGSCRSVGGPAAAIGGEQSAFSAGGSRGRSAGRRMRGRQRRHRAAASAGAPRHSR